MNDIVLITVDSIRADCFHNNQNDEITPNINSIAEDGVRYTNAYANGIPTYFSFKSILGGIHSLSCDRGIGMPMEVSSLPEVLSQAGYSTGGFNAANPWLTPGYGYDRGFDTFETFLDDSNETGSADLLSLMRNVQSRLHEGSTFRNLMGYSGRLFCTYANIDPIQSGETITDAALEWIKSQPTSEPMFLWIHYMDPHYPWVPKEGQEEDYAGLKTHEIARLWHKVATSDDLDEEADQLAETARRLYNADVKYVDSQVGRLLSRFREMRNGEPHVLITGDHGTELGDHGGFSHGPDSLYQEIVRVPFILSSPSIEADRITQPVGLVDIPPTLTDLLSIEESHFEGESVLSADNKKDDVVIEVIYDAKPASNENMDNDSLYAVVDLPWKLIYNDHDNSTELYNLAEDPKEMEDLSDQRADVVTDLMSAIDQHQIERSQWDRTHEEIHSMEQFSENVHL